MFSLLAILRVYLEHYPVDIGIHIIWLFALFTYIKYQLRIYIFFFFGMTDFQLQPKIIYTRKWEMLITKGSQIFN